MLGSIGYLVPGDPNSMTGPQGSVNPGQLMSYTVEFENVGSGLALGVYVSDVLDPSLDDTTLSIGTMYSLTFSSSGATTSTTTATFPWSYDPLTRTVTVVPGNANSNAGGSFVLSANLKSSVPAGTVINNQALVHFPNALQQITPTNTVISAVPIKPQLLSIGVSSSVYLSTASLAAQLSIGSATIASQPIQFQLANFSTTTLTNASGDAASSLYVTTASGNYNLGLNYSGDNFYYLPTASTSTFTIAPRNVILQAPYGAAIATATAQVVISMTDDQGQPLVHQVNYPKTVYLELVSTAGVITPLQSALLSGTSVQFSFSMPQPLQLTYMIRARYAGDTRYAAAISTGVLTLIDTIPPVVVITSPQSGAVIHSQGQVTVNYSVHDADDLSPSATAYLLDLDGSQSLTVANGASVAASTLNQGSWTVIVSAIDWAGNVSSATSGVFLVTSDVLPPRTALSPGSPSYGTTPVYVSSQTPISFSAVDDKSAVGDDLGIGVAKTEYAVDGGSWTVYSGPFYLTAPGAHSVQFYSVDLAGNTESPNTQSLFVDVTSPHTTLLIDGLTASSTNLVLISTDVVSFSTADTGSGVAQTYYELDSSTTPVVYLSTFSLNGGTHTLTFYSVDNVANRESPNVVSATVISTGGFGSFGSYTLNPTTGPIGIPFTITGPGGFGSYNGSHTEVLVGGTTAPISVWNDTTITGTVPGLSTGTYLVEVQLSTTDVPVGYFTVLTPQIYSVVPSSGPIGLAFTLSGTAFGSYGGANTQVLLGGTTVPISVWNDATITGIVPGILSPGSYPVQVERKTSGGGLVLSSTSAFTVVALNLTSVSPSSGPIGITYSLAGSGFGTYNGGNTQVLIGGTSTSISVWNDTNIQGVVPALSTGVYSLVVERVQGANAAYSSVSTFTVVAPAVAGISPSSGPIGVAYTINGANFGSYNGANTLVLIGGATSSISLWNNTAIQGVVPALSTGAYPVTVERISGTGLEAVNVGTFTVGGLSFTGPAPSSGPVGTSITLTGPGFGAYNGSTTRALISGSTMAISVWNDSNITAVVPTLMPGVQSVWIERESGNGVESSATSYFTVVAPAIASIAPSSGPIGVSFTLAGSGFGTYNGSNTQVLIGGATAPISVWNDTSITAVVPGVLSLTTGTVAVQVERTATGGMSISTAAAFTVLTPNAFSLNPSTGPIGLSFTLIGTAFGTYNGSNTQVIVGGSTAPISVWNNASITATVPALASGTYSLQVARYQGGYSQINSSFTFTVEASNIASMVPSSAPIGAPFTLAGSGFGSYNGSNTSVTFNGITAPISVWNDSTITGTVPGAVSSGTAAVVVTRLVGAAPATANAPSFNVLVPHISTISPSYGPAGTAVTLSGFGFGPYAGASGTQLLVNGSTMAVAVWNDELIRWTVPTSLSNGTYPVIVSRTPSGGSVQSSSVAYTVGTSFGPSAFLVSTPAPLAAKPDTAFQGDLLLPATQGGSILTPSLAAVSIPANAMDQDTEVTLARDKTSFAADRAAAMSAAVASPAGEPIAFGPEGTQFSAPVTITLPYDPDLVPTGAAGSLAIRYFDPVAKSWTTLVSQVDTVNHLVSAQTSHFSLYQPLIQGFGVASASQDVFAFRAAYVFPNPVRGTRQADIRIQTGLADSVNVDVYDLTGRKVHSSSAFNFSVTDDLNGLGPQDTYDHVWDISGVGSGVYSYVITAKKAGNADIHFSGKIGVIK